MADMIDGKSLQAARERAGFSLVQLSEAIGRDKNTINRWEHGAGRPSKDDVRKCAEALGVQESDLLRSSIRSPGQGAAGLSSALRPDQQMILDAWEILDTSQKNEVLAFAHSLGKEQGENEQKPAPRTSSVGKFLDKARQHGRKSETA